MANGGHRRHRSRASATRTASPTSRPTSSSPPSPSRWACSAPPSSSSPSCSSWDRACASPRAPTSAFDKLLAVGLTTLIGVQSFIIISGVIRLLPLTGLALPVRVLRRIVAGVELDPDRAAAAHLRRIEPPRARPRDRATMATVAAVDEHPDPPARHRAAGLLPGPVRDAQLDPGRAQARARQQRPQRPAGQAAVQQGPRHDHVGRRRAAGPVGRRDRLDGLQPPARVPAGQPLRPAHRLLLVQLRLDRPRAHLRHASSRARRSPSRSAASPTCSTRVRRWATSRSRCARTCSSSPSRPSATAPGSVVAIDPRTGELLAFWSYPSYRPEPDLVARREDGQDGVRPRQRCARQADAGPPVPGDLPAGLDLQGRHRLDRGAGPAWSRVDQPRVPGGPRLPAARWADHPRHQQLRRRGVRRGPDRDPRGVVQLGLRPDGHRDHRRPARWSTAPSRSASTRSRRSTCPGRPTSSFPTAFLHTSPVNTPWLQAVHRPGQRRRPRRCRWPSWPSAIADGGDDHEAPRHERGARQRGQPDRAATTRRPWLQPHQRRRRPRPCTTP